MMADFDTISKEAREENGTLKELLNPTDIQREMECLSKELESAGSSGESGIFCPYSYDTLLCWPKTPAGNLALLPCFEELNGIKYDTSRGRQYLILLSSYRHVTVRLKYYQRCKTKHEKLKVWSKWSSCLTLASSWHGHQKDYRTRIVVLWAVTSCCILEDRQHDVIIRKAKTSSLLCGPHTLRLSFATVESFLFWSPILGIRHRWR